MAEQQNANEGSMRAALLEILGMVYAVVFGLIVVTLITDVIGSDKKIYDKVIGTSFILELLFFLAWDWVNARRLLIQEPYAGYRRFTLDIIIALAAYGVAFEGTRVSTYAYLYAIVVLGMRIVWAITVRQDRGLSIFATEAWEFTAIQFGHTAAAGIFLVAFMNKYPEHAITWLNVVVIPIYGFLYILIYEWSVLEIRVPGLMGGPGVPFLSHEQVKKLRDWYMNRTMRRR